VIIKKSTRGRSHRNLGILKLPRPKMACAVKITTVTNSKKSQSFFFISIGTKGLKSTAAKTNIVAHNDFPSRKLMAAMQPPARHTTMRMKVK
jgi:hypothetical protein